jgi:hypothetical protein
VPQRASSAADTPGWNCKLLRLEALQLLSGGAGASYREIHEKPMKMVLSRYDDAGCRPGRHWRGVLPYGRSNGRLFAPAHESSQI